MKVIYLTAGGAGMYCGSCMNDNALVRELRKLPRELAGLWEGSHTGAAASSGRRTEQLPARCGLTV